MGKTKMDNMKKSTFLRPTSPTMNENGMPYENDNIFFTNSSPASFSRKAPSKNSTTLSASYSSSSSSPPEVGGREGLSAGLGRGGGGFAFASSASAPAAEDKWFSEAFPETISFQEVNKSEYASYIKTSKSSSSSSGMKKRGCGDESLLDKEEGDDSGDLTSWFLDHAVPVEEDVQREMFQQIDEVRSLTPDHGLEADMFTLSTPHSAPLPMITGSMNTMMNSDMILSASSHSAGLLPPIPNIVSPSSSCQRKTTLLSSCTEDLAPEETTSIMKFVALNPSVKTKSSYKDEETILPENWQPGPWSVIIGKDKRSLEASGNKRLRVIVKMHLDNYASCGNKKQHADIKSKIISDIISTVMAGHSSENDDDQNEKKLFSSSSEDDVEMKKEKKLSSSSSEVDVEMKKEKKSSSSSSEDDVEMKKENDDCSSSVTTTTSATAVDAGAFVAYKNGRWYEVTMKRAREKIGRMLREFLYTQYKSSSKQKRALVKKRSNKAPPLRRISSPW